MSSVYRERFRPPGIRPRLRLLFPVFWLVRLPTRRARCASRPTSPRGGEASKRNAHSASKSPHSFFLVLSGPVSPHPASSLRELADLPTTWGGESRNRPEAARPGSPPPG